MAESSVREPTIRFYRCKRCNKLRRGRGTAVYVPFVYGRKAVSYYAPYCRQCFDLHREELNQETRKEQENVDPFSYFDR